MKKEKKKKFKGVQPEKQLAVQARKELPPPPLASQEKIITQPIDDNEKIDANY